jgi:hypothetical protein
LIENNSSVDGKLKEPVRLVVLTILGHGLGVAAC